MLTLFLACTGSEEPPVASADTIDDTTDACVPLSALFFDLGSTLVYEGDDGLYAASPEAIALLEGPCDCCL